VYVSKTTLESNSDALFEPIFKFRCIRCKHLHVQMIVDETLQYF